jgi:hypothetical protein
VGWEGSPEVVRIRDILRESGEGDHPLYLLSALRDTLKPADLKIQVEARGEGFKIETIRGEKNLAFRVQARNGGSEPFIVRGEVPPDSKKGDIFLVNITADYGKTEELQQRSVRFTEILHVGG